MLLLIFIHFKNFDFFFSQGSVVVKFRIGWTFLPGIRNPPDPIDFSSLKMKLEETLRRNSSYINDYHIDPMNIKVDRK